MYYYNYKSTGRPESKTVAYSCRYQDIDFEPAYPFGYGLSYCLPLLKLFGALDNGGNLIDGSSSNSCLLYTSRCV